MNKEITKQLNELIAKISEEEIFVKTDKEIIQGPLFTDVNIDDFGNVCAKINSKLIKEIDILEN